MKRLTNRTAAVVAGPCRLIAGIGCVIAVIAVSTDVAYGQCELSERAKLLPIDTVADDNSGYSVAIWGDTAVIGVFGDDDNGSMSGSAYIFRIDPDGAGSWVEEAKVLADDGAEFDHFGRSVAISGDWVLIGAPGDDDSGFGSGSAYVFGPGLDGSGSWILRAKLLPDADGTFAGFGRSVAVAGDVAVVGASGEGDNGVSSGSAYVFRFDREGSREWDQEAKLLSDDGAAYDYFGRSVAIANSDDDPDVDATILIGAYGDGSLLGSAYIFSYDPDGSGGWLQQAKLLPDSFTYRSYFGYSVAIASDSMGGVTALVGAYKDDGNGNGSDSGSAYIFEREGTEWMQQAKLWADDGSDHDWFAFSVSLAGDTALIGSYGHDNNGPESGSAYVFQRAGPVWSQKAKLGASDGSSDDWFGYSVSISGTTGVVGVFGDDDNGASSGSAYSFDLTDCNGNAELDGCDIADGISTDNNGNGVPDECDCPGDTNGDGTIDPLDSGFVQSRLGCTFPQDGLGCLIADTNNDGVVDPLDVGFVQSRFGNCE